MIMNQAARPYLQRIVGYALTGDTREQCFFLLYGTGANGKSTFLEMLRDLLGPEYAHHTPFNTLLARRDDVIRADLARMRGARFVTAIEADEGRRFDEAVVKALTGGDTITARNLYESHFEYRPQFKLFLATNYKPEIRGVDDAIWRRVRLVPFTVSIPPAEQDRALRDKLRTEASGILNWALAGCRAWQAGGLADPDLIRDATRTYKHESDLVGEFLKDCCTLGPDQHDDAPKLRREFEDWCKDEMGTTPLPGRAFNRGMTQHGLTLRKGHASRVWVGVHLNL